MTEISKDIVDQFWRDGAVALRGVFSDDWIALLREGVDQNMAEPGPMANDYTEEGRDGRFFGDYCNWERIPAYRRFVEESPAAEIAAQMMRSPVARLFHEHVLVKEPGTAEITPWHHDQPYYCVDGDQVISLWTPLDPVPLEASVRFLAGTHLSGQLYFPRLFKSHEDYDYDDERFKSVPDIDEADPNILAWTLEPGDTVVFHARTLHGAPGTQSIGTRRRAFATRWLGEDAVFAERPGRTSPPYKEMGLPLRPGDPMVHPWFPELYRAGA